jgi:putative transcriptional regulator
MKADLFEELLESVRQGGAILRGEIAPARTYTVHDPDVAEVRERYGLSQAKFAGLLGISVRTLQNWEQHRRRPDGPARILLRVAARHPEAVLDVVSEEPRRKITAVAKATPKRSASRKKSLGTAAKRSRARTKR